MQEDKLRRLIREEIAIVAEKQWNRYNGSGQKRGSDEAEGTYYSHPHHGMIFKEPDGWHHYKASGEKGTFKKTHAEPFRSSKDARRHARKLSSK